MQKNLTIPVDEQVYEGLHRVIGRSHISQFIEGVVRPHVLSVELEAAYREMAPAEAQEQEAQEWAETIIGDVTNATR